MSVFIVLSFALLLQLGWMSALSYLGRKCLEHEQYKRLPSARAQLAKLS